MGSSKRGTKRQKGSVVAATRPRPWGTLIAVLTVLLFAGGVFGVLYLRFDEGRDRREALAPFTPTEQNPDPSRQIEGVLTGSYTSAHVDADQRVAYDAAPPYGGPHDSTWASCNGTVYDAAVRSENMVHSLEHGAVWIAYNPQQLSGDQLSALQDRVEGQSFLTLSPYPGLDSPISLQSWEHQLKLDSALDPRIDQFVQALRLNANTYPEPGAACDVPVQNFDPDNPPPFDPAPPGPGAVPVNTGDRGPQAADTGHGPEPIPGPPQPPAGR